MQHMCWSMNKSPPFVHPGSITPIKRQQANLKNQAVIMSTYMSIKF